jgi:hypothetical protein
MPASHTVKIVREEMTLLKCKRIAHTPGAPDLAITDFDLWKVLEQKMQHISVNDDKELETEILTIFQVIPSDQLKSHLITGSKDASGLPQIQGTIIHHTDKTQYSFYLCASHRCLFQKFIRQPLENIIQGCEMSKNHFCDCASSFHADKLVARSVTRPDRLSSSEF